MEIKRNLGKAKIRIEGNINEFNRAMRYVMHKIADHESVATLPRWKWYQFWTHIKADWRRYRRAVEHKLGLGVRKEG